MRILIYGINYSPELTATGKFSGEMGSWLAAQGHQVRAVVAPPYYPEWAVHEGFSAALYRRERIDGVLVYRCPLFVPRAPRTLSRLLHLLSFSISSLPVVVAQAAWRPDVILSVVPTFFCTPAALLCGMLCGAKRVLHIQDFELDAMVGLGLGREGAMVRAVRQLERFLMKRFDAISTISGSMKSRARDKCGEGQFLNVPNWVDTDFIGVRRHPSIFRQKWGISDTQRVVLYSGNVGAKHDIESVLDVAESFAADADVLFVIVGAGAAYEPLRSQAKDRGLRNIQFHPLQPYESMPELLSLADVHLVTQRRGAADLVMPSKLAAILASGGYALITAEADTELGRLCDENLGIGWRVEPENSDALAKALRLLLDSPDVKSRVGNLAARRYAEENLSKNLVLRRLEQDLSVLRSFERDLDQAMSD